MGTHSPFDEIALKAKVADLSRRLAEAEEALKEIMTGRTVPPVADASQALLLEARETLALEHNLLRTVIDIIPDHVFVRDRSGRHLINNRALLDFLGAETLEETIGKTERDFYPEEAARRFADEDERVMSSGVTSADVEDLVPEPMGGFSWWSTTKVPLRDREGHVIGLVGISRNITERRLAMQKITEQAAMLDQAHDAIMLLLLDGTITYLNGAAEQLYGWPRDEALGRLSLDLVPPEDHGALKEGFDATLERGKWQGEVRIHTRRGDEIRIDMRRSLIRDSAGAPKAQLCISVDVTEKRRRELAELRNQRLESLGTLAGGIAHDLNNVLAPILMAIALLKLKVTEESGRRLLGLLEQNAERGAQLVRQVLAFGRGAEGDRVLVQPMHIAREVEQFVRDTFPKTFTFELHAPRDVWTLTGDPTQLHQVLLNLCVNARDAMPGGGTISLTLENVVLDETFASMHSEAKPGPYVVLSVADTGTGIPHAMRDRIFEPFFTTKDIGKGTGLGLSTSLGIVQRHGGFIALASEEGKGSTFKVYVPSSAETSGASTPSPFRRKGLPRGENELIMIVDDEEPILSVAKVTLERFGYRVLQASNGAAAVSLYALHREAIAAVITDMAMPIMDGPAMAVALRAINPSLRIIGSSGLEGPASEAAARAGVTDFISKPYSAETLLTTLARVLGKSEEEPEPAGAGRPSPAR